MTPPTLIAAAHGTHNLKGQAAVAALIDLVRARRPDVPVELCFVDVIEPKLADVLARVSGPAVVVPILLSTGYHVKVDIPAAVGDRPATVVAAPLGPDEAVSRAVWLRLLETSPDGYSGADSGAALIVIGAGSSDPAARNDLEIVASHLASWNEGPVAIGQLTDADPFALLPQPQRVANYLLSPGFFDDKLHTLAGQAAVGAPIGAHPLVADVIVERYEAAAAALP